MASLLLVAILLVGAARAQDPDTVRSALGHPVVRTISPQAYEGNDQVWDIAQDGHGLLYIASSYGLQQYDGARWRSLPTGNGTTPWTVVRDGAGALYVGARDELGRYRPDSLGRLTYRSALDRVPASHRPVGNVRQAVAIGETVFFRTEPGVLRWDRGREQAAATARDTMQVVTDTTATGPVAQGLFACQDTAYVHARSGRLYRIDRAELHPVPGSQVLQDAGIGAMIRGSTGGCQVVTQERERFRLTSSGLERHPLPGEPLDASIVDAVRGPDGALAVATESTIRLVGPNGQRHRLTRENGLPEGDITALYLSERMALWVATGAGIARVAWPDPVSLVEEPPALQQILGGSMERHEGALYFGTQDGLWRIREGTAEQVAGSEAVFDVLSTKSGLLASGEDGLFAVRDGTVRTLTSESTPYVLLRSRQDSTVVYVGLYGGGLLRLQRRGGQWQITGQSSRIETPVYTVAQDTSGALWLGTGHRGVIRLGPPLGSLGEAPMARFDTTDGLPAPSFNYTVQLGDSIRMITLDGLYRFTGSTLVPDERFAPVYADGFWRGWPVVSGSNGEVWMDFGGHKLGVAAPWPSDSLRWTARPFRRLADFGDVGTIYPDRRRDSPVWFGAEEGLVRYDRRLQRFGGHAQSFQTLIRGVQTRSDSLLYGGDTGQTALPAAVEYDHNALRFQFGATSFEQVDGPTFRRDRPRQYRWRLAGFDEGWTPWTIEPRADYTGLPPGTYTLHVQARNLYNVVGTEAYLSMTVLPPWYRTWWAYGLYGLLALALIGGVVQWRTWRLRRRQEELEATVADRTEEVRRQRDRLEKQAEKLKELDEAKSRFFANISHEFRTPLTLIWGPVQRLRERVQQHLSETDAEQLEIVEHNVARLQRLVDQLLGLARVDAGTYRLDARPIDLSTEVERFAREFGPLAEREDLLLTTETEPVPDDAEPVYADREALGHILSNLLSNAIKFTPAGGRVEVAVDEQTEEAVIEVRDTGVGIPEDERDTIFDRFARSQEPSGSAAREQEGAGIGLAFAQDLVELHGGFITVESTEGGGTTFTVRLPRGNEHLSDDQIAGDASADEDATASEGGISEDVAASPASSVSGGPRSSTEEASSTESTDAREATSSPTDPLTRDTRNSKLVLVVDDNADVRRFVRSILESEFEIIEAADGEEGLQKAREALPDVILADVMMPRMDGREMTRHLKAEPETEAIPVIMVTARAEAQDEVEGLREGADDYVTKPFDAAVLHQRVEGVVALQQRLRRRIREELKAEAGAADAPTEEPATRPEVEQEARSVIREHLTDPDFGVNELAERMAMSRSTLYRKLKGKAEVTPSALITEVRMEEAQSLLEAGEPVTQVAYAVGYETLAAFSNAFDERVGVAPSRYAS